MAAVGYGPPNRAEARSQTAMELPPGLRQRLDLIYQENRRHEDLALECCAAVGIADPRTSDAEKLENPPGAHGLVMALLASQARLAVLLQSLVASL